MFDSPEDILGVSETADIDQINAAYRKLAREHHPDMGGDRHQFQQINEAYEKLIRKSKTRTLGFESPANRDRDAAAPPPDLQPAYENPFQTPKKPAAGKRKSKTKRRQQPESLWSFVTRKLPLQDETTYFILVNALDIFLTYLILKKDGVEANPIANLFYKIGDIQGMVAFKMVIVAVVCVIAQIVALRSIRSAQRLLWFGTAAIGFVVLYSIFLLARIQG